MPNERLWKRRVELELTQADLAKAAGLRQQDLSLIERDGWTPPADVRERLAKALKTTAEKLFEDDLVGRHA